MGLKSLNVFQEGYGFTKIAGQIYPAFILIYLEISGEEFGQMKILFIA